MATAGGMTGAFIFLIGLVATIIGWFVAGAIIGIAPGFLIMALGLAIGKKK